MSTAKPMIQGMFNAGAHFGLGRSRRNPTTSNYIFTTKNRTDIFDLEKTSVLLEKVKSYVSSLGAEGKTVLFVGGKHEAAPSVRSVAQSINMPYVASRWIGGTLTNFPNIRKRIERYEKLVNDKEKGELAKYTKRERMLIDNEISNLEKMYFGIVSMKKLPDVVMIIDPRKEHNAMKEAKDMKIPVIALANSDCDINSIDYPLVGNDGSKLSITYFMNEILSAYQDGKKSAKKPD